MAEQSSRSVEPLHDGVCFHCQQCAEKYLKALMEELGVSIPKIHDLRRLLNALLPHYPKLRSLGRGSTFLSNFAVTVRYPIHNAKKRQAVAALRWMERIRAACRAILF